MVKKEIMETRRVDVDGGVDVEVWEWGGDATNMLNVCGRLLAYHGFGSGGLKETLLVYPPPTMGSNHLSLKGFRGTLSNSRESLIRFDAP